MHAVLDSKEIIILNKNVAMTETSMETISLDSN